MLIAVTITAEIMTVAIMTVVWCGLASVEPIAMILSACDQRLAYDRFGDPAELVAEQLRVGRKAKVGAEVGIVTEQQNSEWHVAEPVGRHQHVVAREHEAGGAEAGRGASERVIHDDAAVRAQQ